MSITIENKPILSHKGAGVASFVLGVTSVVLGFALIGAAGVMTQAGKMPPEMATIIGLGLLAACLVDMIGIGLGVSGAADRSSKKIFPVLGLSLNIGFIVLFSVLVVIGLAMKTH